MDMYDGKDEPKFATKFEHGSQQRDGICTTGDGNAEAVSGMEHLVFANIS